MHEAILYKKLKNNAVQCTACKQFCRINNNNAGVCGVRLNKSGKLYLLVYGKASSFNIDPIEKKPLFHFLPGTVIFSLGTVGCNFGCDFCQNYDISQATKDIRLRLLKEKMPDLIEGEVSKFGYALSPKKIVDICINKNIPSIAYTYNEPAIFFEYLYDTSRLAHKKNIKNVFVSNGYESDASLDLIKPYLDAMNIDLKSFSNDFYTRICKARLQPVLDTIKYAHELGIWTEITTLVIPGKNDSDAELNKIARFIADIDKDMPWHLSAFHPMYKMQEVPSTTHGSLVKAHRIGKHAGLNHVYVGNVLDEKRSSTYCPKCNTLLIRRNVYSSRIENFNNGRCYNCKEKIKGVWK